MVRGVRSESDASEMSFGDTDDDAIEVDSAEEDEELQEFAAAGGDDSDSGSASTSGFDGDVGGHDEERTGMVLYMLVQLKSKCSARPVVPVTTGFDQAA